MISVFKFLNGSHYQIMVINVVIYWHYKWTSNNIYLYNLHYLFCTIFILYHHQNGMATGQPKKKQGLQSMMIRFLYVQIGRRDTVMKQNERNKG